MTKLKLRNLINGAIIPEVTLRTTEDLELADVETQKVDFSYVDEDEIVFYDQNFEETRIPAKKEWTDLMEVGKEYSI